MSAAQNRLSEVPRYSGRDFVRPRVVLSACIEVESCRYDGHRIADSFVRRLFPHVLMRPVCPEFAIGLGIPRDTIRLVDDEGETRLLQPATDRDLTEEMEQFANEFLDDVGEVDGFILKNGSPSCGTGQVKVYAAKENAPSIRREAGIFAREALSRFGGVAIEDEGRLRNHPIRHHFLTQLFSFAELRQMGESPTFGKLVDFQRRYKHLLMVYDEPKMREMGRLVGNHEGLDAAQLYERYAELFREALAQRPNRDAHINALTHMYGHFKRELPEAERHEFLNMLVEMRHHHLTLNAPISVIRSWCARFDYDYLADQSYLEPYPRELVMMRDSGKGLDF